MLTADLVRARRRGDELRLTALDARTRAEALELAGALLDLAQRGLGQRRDELEELCDAVVGGARDRRLAAGLYKLVLDRCELGEDSALDPVELRRAVHHAARRAYLALGTLGDEADAPEAEPDAELASPAAPAAAPAAARQGRARARFDRRAVLAEVAGQRGLSVDEIEAALYSDLRGAQLLRGFAATTAEALVEEYELASAQAMLLRAVRVTVEVASAVPGAYRALFRKLKFLRLLATISPLDDGYRLDIDGPFSLFESATRYGLALALALPAIRELDRWKLEAEVRWGNERRPLTCRLEGRGQGGPPPALADDVAALLAALAELDTEWKAEPAQVLLDLPGVGVCAPDLVLHHPRHRAPVYVELLGYWSRNAVWKRVELIQRGLPHRVVFAVGQHLRVSEAALDGELPGALYVYKRTPLARALLERVERVAEAPEQP